MDGHYLEETFLEFLFFSSSKTPNFLIYLFHENCGDFTALGNKV